jgi:monoamine oxidase
VAVELVMQSRDPEVVIVGGGAAGIAAARRLYDASVDCLIVEARPRLGGRAWTVVDPSGFALDRGCGWLHSADRNPWSEIAQRLGASIDKTPPPWARRASSEIGFPQSEQQEFHKAVESFFDRLNRAGESESDFPAAALLDPGSRWNNLINALCTYINGAELDRVSAKDFDRYEDSGVNWRVVEGLGWVISACGADLPVVLDCPAHRIDRRDKRLKIETAKGTLTADQVVITIPSALLAAEHLLFTPALPKKTEAAAGLPLGVDDKLFMALDDAQEFAKDMRLFGRTDRTATGAYHVRPFGRPLIEAYFGGKLASELEANGASAFFDFAVSELAGLLGTSFGRRLKPIYVHCWGLDPFSRGSYSFARPGASDCRPRLAESVDHRLFFAGEACSITDYSTAHGGWHTGVAAAEQVLAVRGQ